MVQSHFTAELFEFLLEEMVHITDTGCELVGQFPFEDELLA